MSKAELIELLKECYWAIAHNDRTHLALLDKIERIIEDEQKKD